MSDDIIDSLIHSLSRSVEVFKQPKQPKQGKKAEKAEVEQQPEVATASPRVTTAIVLRAHTLTVYQRVAGLRAAQGRSEQSDAGFERPYSVSALIREYLEAGLPELEAELKKAGIPIPD